MEIDLRSVVLYLGKKGMSPQDIHMDIVDTLGDNAFQRRSWNILIKMKSKSRRFNSKEELLEAIHSILGTISEQKLKKVFLEWERRLQQVIASNDNYI